MTGLWEYGKEGGHKGKLFSKIVQHKKRLRKARVSDRKHSKSEQRSFPLKFPSAWINFGELGFLSY